MKKSNTSEKHLLRYVLLGVLSEIICFVTLICLIQITINIVHISHPTINLNNSSSALAHPIILLIIIAIAIVCSIIEGHILYKIINKFK